MITLAKNMSHNFQAMMSLQRQWQHEDGDWNPTDPARFIQPDAFANDKTIWRNQDPVDNNSLATGNSLRNTPTWTPGSFRVAGTWNAPKGIVLSTSYTMVGGPWTGPILKQLPANDPDVLRYGPARFNGTLSGRMGGSGMVSCRYAGPRTISFRPGITRHRLSSPAADRRLAGNASAGRRRPDKI